VKDRKLTMQVCKTCGGQLRGRTCLSGHGAYPSRKIEVVPKERLVELDRRIEEACELLELAKDRDEGISPADVIAVLAPVTDRTSVDGPALVEWLAERFPTLFAGARWGVPRSMPDNMARRLRRWRDGERADVYQVDEVLVHLGTTLSALPDDLYLEERE
jgi:hypothetical protein